MSFESDYTHVLYVDDSGTKDYAPAGLVYGKGVSRHLVFGGVLMTIGEAGRLGQQVWERKVQVFGDEDIEIKSNWLRRPKERQSRYIVPYEGMTDARLTAFVTDVYALLAASSAVLVAACVDKVAVQERFAAPLPPSMLAYHGMMRLAVEALTPGDQATVTFDDMTGSDPGGSPHKTLLDHAHESIKRSGSPFAPGVGFEPIKGRLRFKGSHLSGLVQLADLVAYNVYRECTYGAGDVSESEYPYLKVLHDRFVLPSGASSIRIYPSSAEGADAKRQATP